MQIDKFFRATFAAIELLDLIPQDKRAQSHLLDIGGDVGIHTRFFREQGFTVDLVDIADGEPKRRFVGDFLDFCPPRRYDVVWASHVLEHIQDMGAFIDKMISVTNEGGLLCITVPPLKSQMTFGHVTLWNAGLLLINLIKRGLDCREARVATYGYNVSIITSLRFRADQRLTYYLPPEIVVSDGYFDGNIKNISFNTTSVPDNLRVRGCEDLAIPNLAKHLEAGGKSCFVLANRADSPGARFLRWDHPARELYFVS